MEGYPGRRTMIPPMSPDTLVGGCMDHTRCFKPWGPRCEAVVSVVSRHCVVVKQRGIEHEVARLQILPDDRLLYVADSISSSFSDFHLTMARSLASRPSERDHGRRALESGVAKFMQTRLPLFKKKSTAEASSSITGIARSLPRQSIGPSPGTTSRTQGLRAPNMRKGTSEGTDAKERHYKASLVQLRSLESDGH